MDIKFKNQEKYKNIKKGYRLESVFLNNTEVLKRNI